MSTSPINLEERRRRRSTNPLIAMSYQLEQAINDFELDTCLIATEEGILFAKSGTQDMDEAQEHAALAMDIASPTLAQADNTSIVLADEVYMHVERVIVFDLPMYIIALGNDISMTHLSTFRVIMGLERILQEGKQQRLAA